MSEIIVPTSSKELPMRVPVECVNACELQLKKMTLAGVHVDAMYTFAFTCDGVMKRIVPCRSDAQQRIGLVDTHSTHVVLRILPREAVNETTELLLVIPVDVRETIVVLLVIEG